MHMHIHIKYDTYVYTLILLYICYENYLYTIIRMKTISSRVCLLYVREYVFIYVFRKECRPIEVIVMVGQYQRDSFYSRRE